MNKFTERLFRYLPPIAFVSVFTGIQVPIGGLIIRPFDILFIVVILLLPAVKFQHNPWRRISPIDVVVLVYYGYMLMANWLGGIFRGHHFTENIQLLEYVVIYAVCRAYFSEPRNGRTFVFVCLWGLFLVALVNMGYHVSIGRLVGYKLLDEPKLSYGLLSGTSIFIVLATKGQRLRWLYVLVMLAALPMMVLSGERKGWVAFIMSFSITIPVTQILLKKNAFENAFKMFFLATLGVGLLAIAIYLFRDNEYLERQLNSFSTIMGNITAEGIYAQDSDSSSDESRLAMLDQTIYYVKDSPIFGQGMGTYYLYQMHGEYNRIATDYGLSGFFLYLLVYFAATYQLLTKRLRALTSTYWDGFLPWLFLSFGFVINQFLAGGGLNQVFFVIPLAIVTGLSLRPLPFPGPYPVSGHMMGPMPNPMMTRRF